MADGAVPLVNRKEKRLMVKSASYHRGDGTNAHLLQSNHRDRPLSRLKPHWFPREPEETQILKCCKSLVLTMEETTSWGKQWHLVDRNPIKSHSSTQHALWKSTLLIFFLQDCLLIFQSKKNWLGDSLGAWKRPKVKKAWHVNETTRLSVRNHWPSPCHARHFHNHGSSILPACLSTSVLTLGKVSAHPNQSLLSQSETETRPHTHIHAHRHNITMTGAGIVHKVAKVAFKQHLTPFIANK